MEEVHDEVTLITSKNDLCPPDTGFVDIAKSAGRIRIPIRAISARHAMELEKKYRIPHAPQKMGKNAQGKPTGVLIADPNDPLYLETCEDVRMKSVIAQALAAIMVEDMDEDALLDMLTIGEMYMIIKAANALGHLSDEEVDELKNSSESE